ncbi:sugar phosphate isomerase/epimerase [Acuticoccus sp. M5D2P5]|uniref:sugar phosphate isomerase/epimerase family protein n=1 Tax=Acuticoccus kalidii TaxID=2910977 RepID=UPI001F3A7AF6|nr:sugar phosphate isomerase/epimerase family protein [Acuticoccus kalidii]MCF3933588.1 sugar phosphate isomerase/epimerase [Acuticoccus kalidii]
MRLGINLLCATGHVTEAHRELAAHAKAVGYDLVEVPVFEGEPEHYRAIGRMLDEIGIARTSVSVIPDPAADPTHPDQAVRTRGLAHLDWAVDCAVALGSESIGGPFSAPIGDFSRAPIPSADRARGVTAHRAMAERLPEGMILSLEPLNRFESAFLNTAEEAVGYAEAVGHPAFRLMPDTFHMNIEERDPAAAMAHVAPYAGVVHVAENDRGIPGRGHIDFVPHFKALKAAGWDGIIVVEAFGAALPELAAATRVWRPLFPDLGTLFAEAHDFVRETWERA